MDLQCAVRARAGTISDDDGGRPGWNRAHRLAGRVHRHRGAGT